MKLICDMNTDIPPLNKLNQKSNKTVSMLRE